jgi:hypothetical protein
MFTASRARESVILPQELVPWGPARASLLDQLGNELAPPVQVDIGSGSNDFAFAMSFHPNFGDFLPVNFYGVRFDFTAPNAPDSTITSSFLRLGASSGFYGIGMVPDTASTLWLLPFSLAALLAAIRCKRKP